MKAKRGDPGAGVASRQAALRVLVAVAGGARSDRALDRELQSREWADADRRLITEIVYGSLRRHRTLDRSLERFCRTPWRRLDALVREALRMGAYQAAYLRSVPPRAAVHATVGAIPADRRGAAGLVNAVLRAWLRAGGALDPGGGSLSERLDVPPWLVDRWVARYGEARAEQWLAAALEPAPIAVRVHERVIAPKAALAALEAAGVVAEAAPWSDLVLRIAAGDLLAVPAVRDGRLTARGEAGQLVASLLPPGGKRILDACAGRGGKTVQLAEAADGVPVCAVDLRQDALRDARAAAAAAAVGPVWPVVADMTRSAALRQKFDRVLVDAPCSGLGTLRRHPEIRWRARPRRLRRNAAVQGDILLAVTEVLAAGGLLLYTTCSTEPEENEEVIERLLERCPDLSRVPIRAPADWSHLVGEDGAFRTYPDHPELDGFYAALLGRSQQ